MNKPEKGFVPAQGIETSKAPEPILGNAPITGNRYTSPAFAAAEWDKMWTRVWLIAGLESQLRDAGDFLTYEVGPESILIVRGEDGAVRAFYNVCQHRGNRLVEAEFGSLERFTCAYHAWKYDLTGVVVSVPDEADFVQGSPCGKLKLPEVKCEVFAGFVWVNMDSSAPSLRHYLGIVYDHIDHYKMERMTRTHWITVEGAFNWKCVQDNFNESYHLEFVHPQTRFVMETRGMEHQQDIYANGHARILIEGCRPDPRYASHSGDVYDMMKEELAFWDLSWDDFKDRPLEMRAALQKAKREKGMSKGYDFSTFNDAQLTDHYHYTIFPNLSLSLKPDGCIFLRANPHPDDPNKCYFDMWYFTLFPEGVSEYHSHTMDQMVSIHDQAPHITGKWPEVSVGPAIDQDVRVWTGQQKGLRSRGYTGDYMPFQERRVRYFHEEIDRYLARP
jgi:phenylpropionate dioxygenase-like ring-hydroxylating dioxygenase large terminal subunit